MTRAWAAAVKSGDLETLQRLQSEGADIDAKDEQGQTALMVTAHDGRAAVVEFLIAHGAGLNHTAKFNLTALMLAVVNGHVATVRALVDAGADLQVRGSGAPGFFRRTALDLAQARASAEPSGPFPEIARILTAAQSVRR